MIPFFGDPLCSVVEDDFSGRMIFFSEKGKFFDERRFADNYFYLSIFIWLISLDFNLFEGTGSKADRIRCLRLYEQFFGSMTSMSYFFN